MNAISTQTQLSDVQTVADQIDGICLDVENRLRGSEPVKIEDDLLRVEAPHRQELFEELLLLQLHYAPEMTPRDEIINRFSAYRAIVERVFRQRTELKWRELQPGDRLGKYEIEAKLGEGGFGCVYAAVDRELERPVAIKTPRLGKTPTREVAESFLREARSLARLRHPNIVVIYDITTDEFGWPYLVMERLEPLPNSIEQDANKLRPLFADIARGLEHAHQQNIIHRDLKPQNVLLGSQGQAVISDFGLALEYEAQDTERAMAGTIAYMSPEQIRGQTHWMDGRADIWSLGVMLYEALCGRPPFTGSREQIAEAILGKAVRPPRQFNPAVPADLERVCLKCLEKSPEDRYSTCGDLAEELETPRATSPPRQSARVWKAVATLQAIAMLIVTGFLVFSFGQDPQAASKPEDAPVRQVTVERTDKDVADGVERTIYYRSTSTTHETKTTTKEDAGNLLTPRVQDYPISLPIPADHVQASDEVELQAGDRALVCWGRRWNPVSVIAVTERGIHIRFDGWNTEYYLPQSNLAVPAETTQLEIDRRGVRPFEFTQTIDSERNNLTRGSALETSA